jgi:hypothetical protein
MPERLTTITPKWDDASLRVSSDSAWRAQCRLLQSWYRETVLCEPPGLSKPGSDAEGHPVERLVGSMLSADAVRARPGLNFLSPEIAAYVGTRAAQVLHAGGTIEEDRLTRNMLSSMPLCFNLFGHLRDHRVDAAAVLRGLLALDIAAVERIDVEEAPPADQHLGDRTAFDAFVEYRSSDGELGFLGIETKYTEPFSAAKYSRPIYTALTEDPASGFRPGAAAVLQEPATNQLWRNALLVLSLRRTRPYRHGHVVVLACRGDAGAARAVAGLREQLVAPDLLVRAATLEDLIEAATQREGLRQWALGFRRRYLDLSPVAVATS